MEISLFIAAVAIIAGGIDGLGLFPISHPLPPLHICEGGFLFFASVLASVKDRYLLTETAPPMPEPPYKLARLIESENDRWYIVFYVWNAVTGKIVRKRDYEVDKQPNKSAKRNFAVSRIREINKLLTNGYHINPKKHAENQAKIINFRKEYSIADAFKLMLTNVKNTKRKSTYTSYSSIINMFVEYCKAQGWEKWPVKSLQKPDIISYLDYAQMRGISNTTRNKHCLAIKALLGMMVERNMIEINPASKIKKEPEDIGKNIAFDKEQIPVLKAAIQEQHIRLWYFAAFMYYSFIRPAELGRMRINMINLKDNVIILPPNITKNHKIRYVRISEGLRAIINEMDLTKYPGNSYLFGYGLECGSKPIQKNYTWTHHNRILKELKLDGYGYTVYSWKHTGVVEHYRAGIDIKSLQQQTGHSNLEELSTYLKSLGLLADEAAFDKSPTI